MCDGLSNGPRERSLKSALEPHHAVESDENRF